MRSKIRQKRVFSKTERNMSIKHRKHWLSSCTKLTYVKYIYIQLYSPRMVENKKKKKKKKKRKKEKKENLNNMYRIEKKSVCRTELGKLFQQILNAAKHHLQ